MEWEFYYQNMINIVKVVIWSFGHLVIWSFLFLDSVICSLYINIFIYSGDFDTLKNDFDQMTK